MSIEITEINGTNCKTYLLVAGSDAALVDPVRERYDTYRLVLDMRGLRLQMVLETHMHADHLMLNRDAKEALRVPFVMHRGSPSPLIDRHVADGEVLRLGGERIEVMHTPGHTPDSVCYYIPSGKPAADGESGAQEPPAGAVLTGDTLLIGGSGRTDFPGGDAGQQYDAVTERLFALPEGTVVWPAHDYKGHTSSTIGIEKRSNPRFLGKTRQEYIALMGNLGLALPDKIQQALQVNQSGFEASEVSFPQVSDVAAIPALTSAAVAGRLRAAPPPLLLDVREPEEFVGELGHIEGALLVPMDALEHRLPKLAGYVDRDVVVVCRAGARSASAGAILRRAGFGQVYNLEGGMLEWVSAGLPVQR
jgi:glyoxylase-like metal-dependent hydrolase (beta-lactamase superfamily II)/rhodanese-related sulfurtransferase